MPDASYFDYHAHTPLDPEVRSALFEAYAGLDANPHSQSKRGEAARLAIESARQATGALVGFAPADVIFTSGATEANNLAINGILDHLRQVGRTQILVSAGEHASILSTVAALKAEFDIRVLPLLRTGRIDLDALADTIGPKTGLVSIAAANHEIGTLQPISEITGIAKAQGALVHSDLAQAAGKIPLELSQVDLVSVTAHKLYGPIGIGALCARRPVRRLLTPLLRGGGQEGGIRSGTVPAPLAVAFGAACSIAADRLSVEPLRVATLRDRLLERIAASVEVFVNGDMDNRLSGNLNLRFSGVDGEALVMRVRENLVISTGSACSSKSLEPSHVLRAIGLTRDEAESAIRIGIGRFTTADEVDRAAALLCAAVNDLRAMSGRLRAS
ncbi:cysteine desulfurase [Phyllobacterium sp. 21LDTY02-6]|uniref:cysteine desulfurase family protein n=1 Tax=Phyllobacterium sp. 21LDTY02-6 TaxID=2944903 RepID=UPI00201FC2BD|nr:cysteine desulfurase family protein [Phyllobacterium sp. 21LDTY02-6]MCO4317816.1 cysteine desulfurase [Phyllobacterium sp. 21LDTY02-6]